MLFSDNLEGMNIRMTLGIALDKETDVSEVNESLMTPYLTDYIFFPPEHYYNKDIIMNIMPPAWFSLLSNDRTTLL
jgi:hypothetical protein